MLRASSLPRQPSSSGTAPPVLPGQRDTLSDTDTHSDSHRDVNPEDLRSSIDVVGIEPSLQSLGKASSYVAIIATDCDGCITMFNRDAERLLGYSVADVVGKQTPLLFHDPEELATRGARLSEALHRPIEGFNILTATIGRSLLESPKWTYIHRDGHAIHVTLTLYAIVGHDGEITAFLCVASDNTERQSALRELTESKAQVRSVMDSTSDGVFQVGPDWVILYSNRVATECQLQFSAGKLFWDCFPDLPRMHFEDDVRACMAERRETTYETYYDQFHRWFRTRIFPSLEGINIFFSDITYEKALREQLASAQISREKRIEALSHMAGGLSHEISNPLAIIHATASDLRANLIEAEKVLPSTVTRACDRIVTTSDRAMRILRGLKGFANAAVNQPMEWTSVEQILQLCLEDQTSRCTVHGIDLRLVIQPGIPRLFCREVQICQIITNLVNNSFDAVLQHAAPAPWILIEAKSLDRDLVIDVSDSGLGVEESLRGQVMDAFFTTKSIGMGIGLSLSRAIAEAHGGTLTLVEEHQHTCFELVIPVGIKPQVLIPVDEPSRSPRPPTQAEART